MEKLTPACFRALTTDSEIFLPRVSNDPLHPTKYKYWVGAFGLLTYEKVFFDDKVEKQYGLFGVLPLPILQILNN